MQGAIEFGMDSRRLIQRCTKPDAKEFKKIAVACAIGFSIMGFLQCTNRLVISQKVVIRSPMILFEMLRCFYLSLPSFFIWYVFRTSLFGRVERSFNVTTTCNTLCNISFGFFWLSHISIRILCNIVSSYLQIQI